MSWPAAVAVRTLLAPPGHPPVHQLRVAGEAGVGADAEAFHHARAEALEQRVGPFDEVEQGRHAVGVLEIDGDAAPAALHQVGGHRRRARPTACVRSTRTTSAPRSARSMAANGPGPMPASSTTR